MHPIRRGAFLAAGWALALVLAPARCMGDEAPAARPAWLDEITLNGFLSASYSYNANRPPSQTNQFRVFDFDDDMFKLDEFELVAQRAATRPRDGGFRIDLTLGSSVPRITASEGLFRDGTNGAEDIDLHQAFATYVAPLGSGLRLDAGKFITSAGYEVIDGYDGWNDNATRSILFGYAIPFTHVGMRASYAFSPRASGTVMLVNGWDVARDNNRAKTVCLLATLVPVAPLTINVNGIFGPERAGNDADPRRLLDLDAIWKAGDRLTVGANADWAADENAVAPGQDARWSGWAGYARLAMAHGRAVAARGEYFDDMDGARTGTTQQLSEWTLTLEQRLTPHLLMRADARVDRSNHDTFEDDTGFTDTQPTGLIQAIYAF